MAKQTFHVEGLSDLRDALAELPKATGTNVLKRALTSAGQIIADAGQSNAPRGATGKLAESYTVGTKLSKRQKKQHKKESKVEVFVGPTPHPKSVQTEFGNVHQAAHPHLRPAWDGNKQAALNSVAGELQTEIDKAVARIARRQAKLIAQVKAGK